MDVKTKFDVGDTVLFLMSERNHFNVELFKGTIIGIEVIFGEYGDVSKEYHVKVKGRGVSEKLREAILCHNDREIVNYIFKDKNFRQYLNKDHKEEESVKEKIDEVDEPKELDTDYTDWLQQQPTTDDIQLITTTSGSTAA